MELAKEIKNRELEPFNVFFASFLGVSAELGLISEVTANLVMQNVGQDIARYAKATGKLMEVPPTADKIDLLHNTFDVLQDILNLAGDITFEPNEDSFLIKVKTDTCRFCPKGVGGAEISGTVCPYPNLIASFCTEAYDHKAEVVKKGRNFLVKEGDHCIIEIRCVE